MGFVLTVVVTIIRSNVGLYMYIFHVRAEKWLGGILRSTISIYMPPSEDESLYVALASEIYRKHKTMVTAITIDKITSNSA